MPRPQVKVSVDVDESENSAKVAVEDGLTSQVGTVLGSGDGESRKTSVVIPFPTRLKFPDINARENEELLARVLDSIERVERFSLARIGEVERQLRGAFDELRRELRRSAQTNKERGDRGRAGHLGDVVGSWWCTDPLVKEEPLDSLRVKELIDNAHRFRILVVDKGEFEGFSIGRVFLNGCEVRRFRNAPPKSGTKSLSVLLYRILVRALKECGGPLDPPELAKLWWKDKNFAEEIAEKWDNYKNGLIDYDTYKERATKLGRAAERLSSILEKNCDVSFKTFRQGPYQLSPIRMWAYVELRTPIPE